MKILIALHVIILVTIGACMEIDSDTTRTFIPGTYIRFSVHEFGSEYDTLTIKEVHGQYAIERKWKYERVLDGKRIEPENKKTSMTGIFSDGMLTEQQTGVHYSFDPDKKCLYGGDKRYDKL